MEKNENVSINSGSHNRDYDENSIVEATFDGNSFVISGKVQPNIIGCRLLLCDGTFFDRFCDGCPANYCWEFFPCNFDLPYHDDFSPIFKED